MFGLLLVGCVESAPMGPAAPMRDVQPDPLEEPDEVGATQNAPPAFLERVWEQAPQLPPESFAARHFDGEDGVWTLHLRGQRPVLTRFDGQAWQQMPEMPDGEGWPTLSGMHLVEDPWGDRLWFAASERGLWSSRDVAGSWQRESTPWPDDHEIFRMWRQGDWMYLLEGEDDHDRRTSLWRRGVGPWEFVHDKGFMIIDYLPLDGVQLHAMQYGWITESRDGGRSWDRVTDGPRGEQTPELIWAPNGVVAVTDRGIWRAGRQALDWDWLQVLDLGATASYDGQLYMQERSTLRILSVPLEAPGAPPEVVAEAPEPLHELRVSAHGLFAKTSDRRMLAYQDGRWIEAMSPMVGIAQIEGDAVRFWARSNAGTLHRFDDNGGADWSMPQAYGVRQIAGSARGLLAVADASLWFEEGELSERFDAPPGWFQTAALALWGDQALWRPRGEEQQLFRFDVVAGAWRSQRGLPGELDGSWDAMDARDRRILALQRGRLWKSYDDGESWSSQPLPELRCEKTADPIIVVGARFGWLGQPTACGSQLWRIDGASLEEQRLGWFADKHLTAMSDGLGGLFLGGASGELAYSGDQGASFQSLSALPEARAVRSLRQNGATIWALSASNAYRLSLRED